MVFSQVAKPAPAFILLNESVFMPVFILAKPEPLWRRFPNWFFSFKCAAFS